MTYDIKKLKTLREETGVSFSLCKKALEEAKDNIEEAKQLLSKWGVEKAEGKADRETKEGSVFSYIHHNKKIGVLVEIYCETDFVARNSDFQEFGKNLASQIAFVNPQTVEELLKSEAIREPGKTVEAILKDQILKIGENMSIGKFVRYQI
jgi:elongation factor Ts